MTAVADNERLLRLTTLTQATAEARSAGEHDRAHALASQGADLVDRLEPHERARIARALPRMMLEWAWAMRGTYDFTRERALLDHAYAWAIASDDFAMAARVAGQLAWDNAFTGRRAIAEEWSDRAEALWKEAGRAGLPVIAHASLALLRAASLDFTGALATLDEARASAEANPDGAPVRETGFAIAALRMQWEAQADPSRLGRLCAELATLRAAARAAPPLTRLTMSVTLARLHLFAAQPEHALALLADKEGLRTCRPLLQVHRAMAHLMLHDYIAADADASEAPEGISSWPRCQAEMRILRAAARLALGDPDAAALSFREGVAIAGAHELPVALTVVPSADLGRLATLAFGDAPPVIVRGAIAAAALAPARDPGTARLTDREERLMRTLVEHPGLSVKEIADVLGVSRNTVKSQLSALFRKTGVTNRVQLVRLARARLSG
ncbi:LuxR C-terminal-related transcriptional regulator [Microbacterium sp. JZ31]|uniref:LuxR C-terminal-related transcriptional regulator n=1 Tax=Microbacterium sp. JZ31 TaxID=1906274 RepID=UPI0019313EEF|nr:LuxR C-terminal-related transcriptional regulator [Microbacterium sp. JZ31]